MVDIVIAHAAKRGDLALYRTIIWADDNVTGVQGFVFAVVTSVRRDGGAKRAQRAASATGSKELSGLAYAVGSASECGFDVSAFVEATPNLFETPQDAQAAVRKWLADGSPAATKLDAVLAGAAA